MQRKPLRTVIKKIVDGFITLLLILVLLLLAAAVYTAIKFRSNPEEAYVFGYKPIVIITESMEPTIKVNGIAIVKKLDSDEINNLRVGNDPKKGPILLFKRDSDSGENSIFITHRLIDVFTNPETGEKSFQTKGDNNQKQDQFQLTSGEIKGQVVFIFNAPGYFVKDEKILWNNVILYIVLPIIAIVAIMIVVRSWKRRRTALMHSEEDEFDDFYEDESDEAEQVTDMTEQENEKLSKSVKESDRALRIFNRVVIMISALISLAIILSAVTILVYRNNPEGSYIFGHKPYFVKQDPEIKEIQKDALIFVKEIKSVQDLQGNDTILCRLDDSTDNVFRKIERVFSDGSIQIRSINDAGTNPHTLSIDQVHAKVVGVMNDFARLSSIEGILLYVLLPLFVIVAIIVSIRIILVIRRDKKNAEKDELEEEFAEEEQEMALSYHKKESRDYANELIDYEDFSNSDSGYLKEKSDALRNSSYFEEAERGYTSAPYRDFDYPPVYDYRQKDEQTKFNASSDYAFNPQYYDSDWNEMDFDDIDDLDLDDLDDVNLDDLDLSDVDMDYMNSNDWE